jgi:hypothetical protein
MTESKPFCISKWAVLSAWARVRDNKGAAGVDEVSIEAFEQKLKSNLYRIWNRMSSGSYMPPPVRRVMIPKADGKQRPLGIPTVGDRVAQMVVKMELEPKVEHLFHPDSYGYRPKKSALSVTVQGLAQDNANVNYWIYGIWASLCGESETVIGEIVYKRAKALGYDAQGRYDWFDAGFESNINIGKDAALPGVLGAPAPPNGQAPTNWYRPNGQNWYLGTGPGSIHGND